MSPAAEDGLARLRTAYDELVDLHGWSAFRTPRNMTLALTGRVGAVAAQLQFADDHRVEATPELRAELADCLVYLVGLTQTLEFDVLDEAVARIEAAVAERRAET
jgi:hypothetical protein